MTTSNPLFISFIFLFVLAAFLYLPTKRSVYKQIDMCYLVIAFLVLFVLHAFKNPWTLPDTPTYVEGFVETSETDWYILINEGFKLQELKAEPGWVIMNKLLSMISSNFLILFLVTSFVILWGYFYAIKHYSNIVWMGVILFLLICFSCSLFILRQFLAMAITLFSCKYVIERKPIPFLLLITLAFTMHQTAVIFLPVYFLYGIKNDKTLTYVFIGGGIFLTLVMGIFLRGSLSYLYGYETYVDNSYLEGANLTTPIIMWAVFAFRFLTMKRDCLEQGANRLLTIILLCGAILSTAGIGFVPTGRLGWYFTMPLCVIIPNTIYHVHSAPLKIASTMVFIAMWLYIFLRDIGELGYQNILF